MTNSLARAHDVSVRELLHSITVGRGPIADIAVDGDTVVVANFADDSLAVLDADTLAGHGGIFAGQPTAVATSLDRAFVAVSSASYDAIAMINTTSGEVMREYPLHFTVTAIVASPDGRRIFAGRAGESGIDVAVIDVMTERVGTIYIADRADATIDALHLDASGRRLYVAVSDALSSRLITVDVASSRMRGTLEIGAPIRGLGLGLDGTAYVLTSDIGDGGVLHIVDLVANKVVGAATVAQTPTQMVLSVDATRAYVVDYDRVAVVSTDTGAVVAALAVGARPSAVAVSGDRLYVADFDGCVTVYAQAAPAKTPYSQFLGTDSPFAPAVRELEPLAV